MKTLDQKVRLHHIIKNHPWGNEELRQRISDRKIKNVSLKL